MQAHSRLTNALLSVIAVCLVLIVLELFGGDPRAALAQATAGGAVQVSNVPLPVQLVAPEPVRVQLYWQDAQGRWRPMAIDGGALIVRQ